MSASLTYEYLIVTATLDEIRVEGPCDGLPPHNTTLADYLSDLGAKGWRIVKWLERGADVIVMERAKGA